jgi:integrase
MMVRKTEFIMATWKEVDFSKGTWTIPSDRMKGSRSHVIYLPPQAQDLMVGLQMCAGGVLFSPGRYSTSKPLSNAALNSVIDRAVAAAADAGENLQPLTVHDLRAQRARFCMKRDSVRLDREGAGA